MKENLTIIILGATGDLSKLKLIPSIYGIIKNKSVKEISIIGVASSETSAEFILSESVKNIKDLDNVVWDEVRNNFHYQTLNFYKEDDYLRLKSKIEETEKKKKVPSNRLFYLATLPEHFETITHNLNRSGLINNISGWQRVIYEKPFGYDLKSAKKINSCINKIFSENNTYRADHYLGKELISSISLFRFTNRILEPLWSKNNIDSVQIIMDENLGIKNRGLYYDKYGAVKDMMQSHALQILALLTMESPKKIIGEYIRDEKAKILKRIKVKDIILGQYDGYTEEVNVKKDSKTETFFAAKLEIDNKRWKGVPFYIRAGKNLNKKETVVHVRFKSVDCLLAKSCPSDNNYLTIKIQPDDGFSFEVNSKVSGKSYEVETIILDHSHHTSDGPNTPEAYSVLLEEAIKGDQSFFIREDEVESSWKIIDDINIGHLKVFKYKVGSLGPKELKIWSKNNNLNWKS